MNQVCLVGNVGRDPEIRNASQTQVANVTLATTDYAGKEKGNVTNWHRVVFFGKLAGVVGQYVHKGSKIGVVGTLTSNTYTDQQGQKRTTIQVVASNLDMLDSKPRSQGYPQQGSNPQYGGPPQGYPQQNQQENYGW